MAIAAWALAIGTVAVAWLGAAALVATEFILTGGDLEKVLAGCVAALRAAAIGEHGTPAQAGLHALAVLAGTGLVTLAAELGRACIRRAGTRTGTPTWPG